MFKKHFKNEKGYTIIETMIAVSLFLVVTMIGMGALLNANLIHRKSQDMRSLLDNLSFIMEDMSRNLRTGYNYRCITGEDNFEDVESVKDGANCWGIAFESATGQPDDPSDQWVYYIDETGKIFKSTHGASGFIQLTPSEVVVDSISSNFSVVGAEIPVDENDLRQPFVTLKLAGKISYKNVDTPFSLQTSVSQRLINIVP